MRGFVLVGRWTGSGKTTLSPALASELGVPHLFKDVAKEALMDALGAPPDVEASRRLGRGAVFALLAAAHRARDPRHLDSVRTEAELWGEDVAPLGVGPLLEVDTAAPVGVPRVADSVRSLLTG